MKKTLLALAMLGSFASAASAQSSVTVYGVADAGLVSERGGATGTINKLTSGAQSGSRLGFRGKEELGGGLNGVFVLETGIAIDAGGFNQGNTAFARQSFVGLNSNSFGTLTLGRQYTPYYLTLSEVTDPFGTGLAGQANNLMATSGVRMNNTIKYATPNFSGFIGEFAYGFGEVPDNSDAGRAVSASVGYANGPLNVRFGYHNVRNNTDTGTSKNSLLAANYNFNVVKLYLAYGEGNGPGSSPYPANPNNVTGAATTVAQSPYGFPTGPGSDESREALIGVSVPFGASTVLASYVKKDDRSAAGNDAYQWALGYTYAVSKRTNFYAAYARISNDNTASYTVGNASEAGSGDKAFNIGVRHLF
ncbi:MAG: porin [Pseudomonadota bacterium]